jgi:hypothetical protein
MSREISPLAPATGTKIVVAASPVSVKTICRSEPAGRFDHFVTTSMMVSETEKRTAALYVADHGSI